MTEPRSDATSDDEAPDPKVLWGWVAEAVRPYLGWIFMAAGAFFILLGYLGVSRETIVSKQLPYLISGGIGGILLAVLGAYFLGTEELRKDSGRLDRMEQQVAELHRALLAVTGSNGSTPLVLDDEVTTVVAVASGSSYHRPGCALVQGKEVDEYDPDGAVEVGLVACSVCEPDLRAAV